MNGPRTTREALIAEMLGELDTLLARVEALPKEISAAETQVANTVATLNEAGDKYRMAVTAFTEQAKTELKEFLQRKAGEVAAKTVEEQRAAIQDAARQAFRSEASDKAAALGIALGQAAKEFRRTMVTRLLEHGFTALVASVFTSGLVVYFLR